MSPYLNLRARLERANRNNHKAYSAWETFRKFKWFTLSLVILMPIYPSLSVLGSDYSAATDYDESSIITAYNDDEETPAYIAENGFIKTEFDVTTPLTPKIEEAPMEDGLAKNPPEVQKKSPNSEKYIVKSGDTVAKIALKYGVSVDTIYWANDLEVTDILSVGMTLRVPPVSGVVYRVASGDTISEIASRYNVDADDIVRVNNLANAASIRKGMDLMIPGAAPKKINIAKVVPVSQTLTPIPQPQPTPKPVIEDSEMGLKNRYAVKYNGLSR